MRQLIERLLPWYDPEREAAKDRRVDELVHRVDDAAMRRSFGRMNDRFSHRHR